jgi:hypothetical protein
MLGRCLQQNKLIVGKPLIAYSYGAVRQASAASAAAAASFSCAPQGGPTALPSAAS